MIDHATNFFAIDSEIYVSMEALEAYLQDVRQRRERRNANRQERLRLQQAMARIEEEIEATRQDDDAEILAELEAVQAQFARRLYLLCAEQTPTIVAPVANLPEAATLLPEPPASTPTLPADNGMGHHEPNYAPITASDIAAEPVAAPPSPVPQKPPISAEERTARVAALAAELETIATRWRDIGSQSLCRKDGQLDRPLCLHTRALACSLAGIRAEASEQDVLSELRRDIGTLRGQMERVRIYANDTSSCLPFDDDFLAGDGLQLTADDWEELAYLYQTTAEAQSAWEWYDCHLEMLDNGHRLALLNAIGAAQQMLFRALEEFGSRDKLQGDLYGNLRAATGEVGFLNSLDASMSWDELDALASRIAQHLAAAQHVYQMRSEARTKEARKTAAIEAVLHWNHNRVALSKFTLDRQRAELLHLLDECVAAGVPPTHLQVRGALLEHGPMLLEGQQQYCKFLDAVLEERKRKGMDRIQAENRDAVGARKKETNQETEEDEPADSKMEEYRQYVSLLTEGQKLLILGGVPRMRVCEDLKQMLNCAEVKWPESKKGDRANKFQNDINRADFLILVKNFASHEMTEKGREWMRARGGNVVLLPGGYGVNQIIHQLYNYATTRDGVG